MDFVKQRLADFSSLSFSFFVGKSSNTARKVLMVRFEGATGSGCSNNGDATFMTAIVAAGLKAWEPSGLILDLRELSYSWGDLMVMPFCVHPDLTIREQLVPFPTVAVISDLNRVGMTSLVKDEMLADPDSILFDSVDDAAAEIERQLENIVRLIRGSSLS